jgi:hypothetical protein
MKVLPSRNKRIRVFNGRIEEVEEGSVLPEDLYDPNSQSQSFHSYSLPVPQDLHPAAAVTGKDPVSEETPAISGQFIIDTTPGFANLPSYSKAPKHPPAESVSYSPTKSAMQEPIVLHVSPNQGQTMPTPNFGNPQSVPASSTHTSPQNVRSTQDPNQPQYTANLTSNIGASNMPVQSRLFIGNLASEKTTPEDIAEIFVKVVQRLI